MTNRFLKTRLLAAVSIIAIGFSATAMAQPVGTLNSERDTNAAVAADRTPHASPELQQRIKNDLNKAADAVSDTYDNVKASVKQSLDEHEQAKRTPSFSNPEGVNQHYTATGMMGKDVLNTSGEKIATVHDVIVDQDGNALLLVVKDGGVLGLGGKDAAFDYSVLVNRNADGDVFVPLSQEQISNATPFSYDPNDTSADVRRIPQGGFSAAQLIKGRMEDANGKRVARIENVTFENGRAQNLIVAFDTILGMGGKKASVDFQDVRLVRVSDKDTAVRLNNNQAAAFENFKRNVAR